MASASQKWTVQIKGDKELQRKIKNMGLRLPEILEPAAAAGAMVVVTEAQTMLKKVIHLIWNVNLEHSFGV